MTVGVTDNATLAEHDPAAFPRKGLGAGIVVESTGLFTGAES